MGRHGSVTTDTALVRLVATGDLHIRAGDPDWLTSRLPAETRNVDVLLIAGDITENGRLVEAQRAVEMLVGSQAPIVAVMGNHDLRTVRRIAFRNVLMAAGITVLDGASSVLTTSAGVRVGFAGVSGCGGGFWPTIDPGAIHARAWNTVAIRQRREAAKLDLALSHLDADLRIVLMHFAPTPTTLGNEPEVKYWMLGNGELGRVIDRHRVDLVVHGHAHLGSRFGQTAGGTDVRNVAFPVHNDFVRLVLEQRRVNDWLVADVARTSLSA